MNERLAETARSLKTARELQELARTLGMELTEAQAVRTLAGWQSATGELSDEELDNVSGGGCSAPPPCPMCGSTNVRISGTQDYPLIECPACGYNNRSSLV